jgi:hypothetical protein
MTPNFNIEEVCEKCYYDPRSHSFHLLTENDFEKYYYTCPAMAKHYDDAEGIIKHMYLELNNLNKPWIWIFDCAGFGLKHLCATQVAHKIIEFLNKTNESFNLKHLIIVNQNFTSNIMINILWYLLDKRVINKFIFDKKKQFVKVLDYDDRLSTIQESLLY